jgi:hypothetical protein
MRRLPHQGARHGTVDHGDASDGVFLLLHLWVLPSSWVILLRRSPPSLSLACGSLSVRMALSLSLSCEWRRLQELRVENPSGARKGGPNRPWKSVRPTGPGPSRPGSVAPSLPWVLMYLCTFPPPLALFGRCHPRVQDGGSPCMKSSLLRFNPRGCSFVTLRSLPPLEVILSSS